jgi:hypothetical protein
LYKGLQFNMAQFCSIVHGLATDIRCIVHMEWPRTILDYAQESGRAGRDGLRSEAIIIGQEGEERVSDDKQVEAWPTALVHMHPASGTFSVCLCHVP